MLTTIFLIRIKRIYNAVVKVIHYLVTLNQQVELLPQIGRIEVRIIMMVTRNGILIATNVIGINRRAAKVRGMKRVRRKKKIENLCAKNIMTLRKTEDPNGDTEKRNRLASIQSVGSVLEVPRVDQENVDQVDLRIDQDTIRKEIGI